LTHSALLAKLPAGHYHPGSTVVSVDLSDPTSAVIELESRERIAGHLIVAADG
jgi:2-polyprenyl-6-methoxyphenol hydroxylase-like FAD-dependent oxidoreductase